MCVFVYLLKNEWLYNTPPCAQNSLVKLLKIQPGGVTHYILGPDFG